MLFPRSRRQPDQLLQAASINKFLTFRKLRSNDRVSRKMVHTAMVASIVSSIVTRTPTAKIGDKPLIRLDSWKETRFGFRSVGFGFRSRRTLILFQVALISFRRILNSFHPSWRLERGGVDPLRLAALQNAWGRRNPLKRLDSRKERPCVLLPQLGFSFPRFAVKDTSAAPRNSMNNNVNWTCGNAVAWDRRRR